MSTFPSLLVLNLLTEVAKNSSSSYLQVFQPSLLWLFLRALMREQDVALGKILLD